MTVTSSNFELRENDLYETEPWAVDAVIRSLVQLHLWQEGSVIWEPSAGNHAMVRSFKGAGAGTVITSDICEYTRPHTALFDFLSDTQPSFVPASYNIITNPPYGRQNRLAVKYARRALHLCSGFVALLLTAKFDFGNTRTDLFANNPRFRAKVTLLDRISWAGNGETGTEDHAWYIWGPTGAPNAPPTILYESKKAMAFL